MVLMCLKKYMLKLIFCLYNLRFVWDFVISGFDDIYIVIYFFLLILIFYLVYVCNDISFYF